MMLCRMKYLLKIPLLAISMACNRSAQEIKMIVPQSPVPLSPSSQTPLPPFLQTHTHSLFTAEKKPLHKISIIDICILTLSLHDNSSFGRSCMFVCERGASRSWASSLNYRRALPLSWAEGECSVRQLHQHEFVTDQLKRKLCTGGTSKSSTVFVPNSCQVVQGRSMYRSIIGCLSCVLQSTHFQRQKGQDFTTWTKLLSKLLRFLTMWYTPLGTTGAWVLIYKSVTQSFFSFTSRPGHPCLNLHKHDLILNPVTWAGQWSEEA